MPETNEEKRVQVDLTQIYEKLPSSITESLFRNTVKVLTEQHYIKEGILKNGGSNQ